MRELASGATSPGAGRLAGRVAIVTGAGRGIGLAIAARFAREGANVVVADINDEQVHQAASAIGATAVSADVGLAADVDRLVNTAVTAFGTVDILVNNAAETGRQRHFLAADEQWWDDILRTNLKSQYLCVTRVAPIMAARRRGSIINLSSGGATRAHRGMVAYDASKGGVEALTRATALELAPYGVRVNALVPGLVATNPTEPERSRALRDHTVPLGRGGTADDLAGPAVFLASDDAAYVTGIRLVVDGGVLVQQRSPQVDTLRPEDFPEVPR